MKPFLSNKKAHFFILLTLIAVLLIAAGLFLTSYLTTKVKRNVTIEAGSTAPHAEFFLADPNDTVDRVITDLSAIDTNSVGKIKIELEVNGKKYKSVLIIADTVPPQGEAETQYIFKGNDLQPEDLVANIEDATQVTFSFASPPDLTKMGWQDAVIVLTDEGGNRTNVASKFYIFQLIDEMIVESGAVPKEFAEKAFVVNYVEGSDLSFGLAVEDLNFSTVGSFRVTLMSGKFTGQTVLTLEDTGPPKGEAAPQYIFKGNDLETEDLVKNVKDATQVTCSFANPPDLTKTGWQDAVIVLTDEGKNETRIDSGFYIFELIDELVVEAGTKPKDFSEKSFIQNYTEVGSLSFDIPDEALTFSTVGSFDVTVSAGKFVGQSVLTVADTISPKGEAAPQYIFKGNDIEAADLVKNIKDATQVTCTFANAIDLNKTGWQDVEVVLTDEGGNETRVDSQLYTFELIDELVIEAGAMPRDFSEKSFLKNYTEASGLSFDFPSGALSFSTVGSFDVTLKRGKFSGKSTVKIVDTTPPAASIRECWTYRGKSIAASEFAYNIKDFSPVTVRYKQKPDFNAQGVQTVYIILEDAYKNTTEYSAKLIVVVDTEPPVISGALNKSVVAGGSISYRSGITVSDNYDPNAALTVDSSRVNLNTPGVYTIIYSAVDISGNRTEVKGTLTVRAVTLELVYEMADNILAQIITSGMSQYNKARAIYNWVNNKMKYSASITPRSLAQGAYGCFSKGQGDCYTYMAGSRVLLTRAGIQNAEVSRMGGDSPHYWNLVNTGNGWYHFDVCPTPANAVDSSRRFMFSESDAESYTKIIGRSYYIYNKTTVPEVVK